MPPLGLVALGLVNVIERAACQVTAPAVAVGHEVFAVVVTLVDRVGIDRRRGRLRPLAGVLQFGSLRQAVLLPAEGLERIAAPRQRAVRPEVGLGNVAVPILRQLRCQKLGLGGVGHGMRGRVPFGFQAFDIVRIVRHDPGELGVTPPGGQAGRRLLDDDPMALLLCPAGRLEAKGDPAGGDGSYRDGRQGQQHNYESRDIP